MSAAKRSAQDQEELATPRNLGLKNHCSNEILERRPSGHEMKLLLKQLAALVIRKDRNEEMLERTGRLAGDLASLVTSVTPDGETPNPMKLLQMHLKCTLFNSEAIKDGDNIKTFLDGLEDCSAVNDDSVHVFLAIHATELWYQWDEEVGGWKWTPEADGSLWMPCTTLVVSAGGWKGETPAPENQLIIDYLDAVRPVPSDEQYLPAFCDILHLLDQLTGLGEKLAQVARKIARAVLDFDVVNRDAKSVKEALKKLEVFVKQSSKVEREGGTEKEGKGTEVDRDGGEGNGGVEVDKEREKSEGTEVKSEGTEVKSEGTEVEGDDEGVEGDEEREGTEVKGTGGEGNGETNKDREENEREATSGEAKENGDERGG